MNTYLNSEQQNLINSYRNYVKESILPLTRELDDHERDLKDLMHMLGQKGFLGVNVPKEYGGQGSPFLNFCLFVEALGEVEPGIALALASHQAVIELLSAFGTDKQKSRYLPLLARGECIGAFASTEETAGSDYQSVRTIVNETEAGKLKLKGKKTWVVNGDIANLVVLTARWQGNAGASPADKNDSASATVEDSASAATRANLTEPITLPAGRLSLWLVDMESTSSKTISSNRGKLGLRSASTNDIEFTGTEIPADAYLGKTAPDAADNDEIAIKQIEQALDISKVVIAAAALGLLESSLQHSVDRAKSREQFGANIGKLEAIQWKLADMSAESSAARLITYRAAWSKEHQSEEFRKFAAMAKLHAARAARVHSAEAVQIFGAAGISEDEPMEKIYRDAKVMEICEGTSEIQKNIIARQIGN